MKDIEEEINKNFVGFGTIKIEPWLLPYVESAIQNLNIPWDCDESLIVEVKKAAVEAVINGWASHSVMEKLVPSIFKTKREAKWVFASLFICGMSAINHARLKSMGCKKFRWSYLHIPKSCIYKDHIKRDGKKFDINFTDWPASKYLCRCAAESVF